LFEAIILGIVQGLTEFIPISSSAHLIIVPWLFGWKDPFITSIGFDVALHLGTLLAVLLYFARDWLKIIGAGFRSLLRRPLPAQERASLTEKQDRTLAWAVAIGTIPGAVAGWLLEGQIDSLFHQPDNLRPGLFIIAGTMTVMGSLLLLAELLARHSRPMAYLTLKDAILIGLSQALAVIPGVSRSGSTITTGLAMGLTRDTAARFSFLLSGPIILGAGLKGVSGLLEQGLSGSQLPQIIVGFLASGIVGYLCITFLLAYLRKGKTYIFVGYRYAVAILIVAVLIARG